MSECKLTAEILNLLDGPHFGQLATASAGGVPHVDTVWLQRDGERIVVASTLRTLKGRNLQANPAAAMVVTHRDNPYEQAQLKLRLQRILPDEDMIVCDRIAQAYIGAPFPQRRHRERVAFEFEILSARHHRVGL